MSYPAPPPPGGAGPNPYQSGPPAGGPPAGGPPGMGGPMGPAPKKDNTLWWILGIIAAVVLLCCCSVGGFFIFVANEASDQVSSMGSSHNSDTSGSIVISEGGTSSVNSAAIQSGWSVTSNDDISGLMVRNDSGSSDSFYLTFYFMDGGTVIDDVTCNTDFLEAGETDYSPNCVGAINDIQNADEIRVKEGL